MTKKYINFDFYQVILTGTNVASLPEGFDNILSKNFIDRKEVKGFTREIYRLEKFSPNQWIGQFRKYRTDQLPAYATFGEDEIELELKENQGIIERNTFIYYIDMNILVWQYDAHANHPERFADFLSVSFGSKVEVAPILTKNAISKLMKGGVEALKFDLSVARPTAPSLYDSNSFTKGLFSLMSNSGSDLFNLSGGIDLRSKEHDTLTTQFKSGLASLVESGAAKKAKVVIEDEGKREILDLITDRVKASRQIETLAKSIPFMSMVDMINSAYEEKRGVLNEVIGTAPDSLS
ncbi:MULTISPECIES: DUF6731 family protein [Acinetobacter calcoaceticus/baumannii complex]|uniref:DUF6731 family protein n=1 Tax=Acinetobacter calcoaceticus/baumannii complex TaxID=909768 RepID=UPI0020BEE0B0|nr:MULTISPECIES: DUF6731 family protein [Acinetobacter calcoaceticus/baumannii complex]MCL6166204.1 hypothetical protein [Acinetobacter baumannii]MCL6168883.1 hypothetical protein [Acinetobacter baumannii]MCL6171459.1 hypothetical protein [Acinetobacter baumannii]MCL6175171.1 hypothetical protein [Acinetobacter baumannii]MCL6179891.1 hypothetical protein [Acinetobacter baumannii]